MHVALYVALHWLHGDKSRQYIGALYLHIISVRTLGLSLMIGGRSPGGEWPLSPMEGALDRVIISNTHVEIYKLNSTQRISLPRENRNAAALSPIATARMMAWWLMPFRPMMGRVRVIISHTTMAKLNTSQLAV